MELRHLNSFVAIVQHKNYSKAAQSMFVSQSTITTHISELEQDLGVRLFYRNHQPVQLTEEGEIFLVRAKQIIATLRDAQEEVNNHRKGIKGKLRLCVSESRLEVFMEALKKFNKLYPSISLDISVDISSRALERIDNGSIDLGIIKTYSANYVSRSLSSTLLLEDEAALIFSPQSNLAQYDVIPSRHLRMFPIPLVIFCKDTDFWDQIAGELNKAGFVYNDSISIDNAQAVKMFLTQSKYMAILPKSLVTKELADGTLLTRPIQDFPLLKRYSVLIYSKKAPLSTAAQQFYDFLLNELGIEQGDESGQ